MRSVFNTSSLKFLSIIGAVCFLGSCTDSNEAKELPKKDPTEKETPKEPEKAAAPEKAAVEPGNPAFAYIKNVLNEVTLGASREEVTKRDDFNYDEGMDLSASRQHGVSVFVHYEKDGSVVSMQIQDTSQEHKDVIPILNEILGEPTDNSMDGIWIYRKKGSFRVKCEMLPGKLTSIDLRAEAAVPPWDK